MTRPSAAQKIVRQAFKASCVCFNRQLDAGGVVPPAIGYRDKPWWHTDSQGSGLRYYNYFIHETEPFYLANKIPAWCTLPTMKDSYVSSADPNFNFDAMAELQVQKWQIGNFLKRAFIKTSGDLPAILHVYLDEIQRLGGDWQEVGCYSVVADDWEADTITWNNQPAIGGLLDSKILTDADLDTWISFNAGSATSICLKLVDETILAGQGVQYIFDSSGGADKPYLTEAES